MELMPVRGFTECLAKGRKSYHCCQHLYCYLCDKGVLSSPANLNGWFWEAARRGRCLEGWISPGMSRSKLKSCLAAYSLCTLEQVTSPLWAPFRGSLQCRGHKAGAGDKTLVLGPTLLYISATRLFVSQIALPAPYRAYSFLTCAMGIMNNNNNSNTSLSGCLCRLLCTQHNVYTQEAPRKWEELKSLS